MSNIKVDIDSALQILDALASLHDPVTVPGCECPECGHRHPTNRETNMHDLLEDIENVYCDDVSKIKILFTGHDIDGKTVETDGSVLDMIVDRLGYCVEGITLK